MNRARPPLTLLLSLFLLFAAAGCSEDDPVKVREDDPIGWPDLTSRDDVIETIVLCYENPSDDEAMTRYEGLLHSQYFFVFDIMDVPAGGAPIMTRAHDILSTQFLFENHAQLELSIDPEEGGFWQEIPELNGEPCGNCWEGRREYYIRFQRTDGADILQSVPGAAAVTIIVAPDEDNPSKWVLRAMYDEYNR